MSIASVGSIVNIVRQINLGAIKKEAESRITVAVIGVEPFAGQLAAALSEQPGMEGIHPWLERLPLPVEAGDLGRFDVAVLLSDTPELSAAADSVLRRLEAEKSPAVVVIVNDEATRLVGGDLPRAREAARVTLPTALDDMRLQQELVPALIAALPGERQLALGRHFPRFRSVIARQMIEETSRANAVYALTTGLGEVVPGLNIALGAADILVLTKNQLMMAYKLALLNGKQGEPKDVMGEVIGVVGGGFLFRQVARELIGLIPVIGIVPKVAVSYAGTWLIGRTVQTWASQGQELGADDLRSLYDEAISRGRAVADSLMERVKREKEEPAALPAPATEAAPPRRRWWHRIPLIGRLLRRLGRR